MDLALTPVDEDRSDEMELAVMGATARSPAMKIQSVTS
jgi:hypothetical protein